MLLRSTSALSRETEFAVIKPHTKKLCNDERAVDVIGPVESGERIRERKGPRSKGSGKVSMSGESREYFHSWKEQVADFMHLQPLESSA